MLAVQSIVSVSYLNKGVVIARACPHFENGDKNEVNGSQTRKGVQIISRY